jgi:hypothetical protein
MNTIKAKDVALVAVVILTASLVTAATLSLAPNNLKASTQEGDDGDDCALTQTITQNKDGEE